MSNCNCSKEMMCDGSGRLQRYLKALDPQYTPVDGRSIEELLVFAKRYAGQIKFYDVNGKKDSNDAENVESWKEFFRRDLAVIAASIGVTECSQVRKDYDEIRDDLNTKADPDIFAALFEPIVGIAVRLDTWYSLAMPGNPLFADIELAIKSTLKREIEKINAYVAAYKLIDIKNVLKPDFSKIKNNDLWGINADVQPQPDVYEGTTYAEKIRHAALYIDDIFNVFYNVLEGLVDKADDYLLYAMEQYPDHKPHMALFISFLQLFMTAQNQMNGITERMLNFYYTDVLHLTAKPAIPDHAHVVFELAKGVSEYAMPAGTDLKAGKDTKGVEQIYSTENEIVINQAKVKELKTIFINKTVRPAEGGAQEATIIDAFYGRPVANSKDGFGAAFDDATGKWPTFGIGQEDTANTGSICDKINRIIDKTERVDQAKLGFAVASPQLMLQGGKRLIRFQCGDAQQIFRHFKNNGRQDSLEIWLTGEKGWIKITDVISEEDFKNYISPGIMDGVFGSEPEEIKSSFYIGGESTFIYLPIDEHAVTRFDKKLHPGYVLETEFPVMCFLLKSSLDIEESTYNKIRVGGLSLSVKVGSINRKEAKNNLPNFDGLKQLVLQNDDGPIAPGKPFHPFTALPGFGKSLYIGSDEIFNKPVQSLSVNVRPVQDRKNTEINVAREHVAAAASINAGGVDVRLLYEKEWLRLATENNSDFSTLQLTWNILYLKDFPKDGEATAYVTKRRPVVENKELDGKTEKGFLSITLPDVSLNPGANETIIQKQMELAQSLQIKEISLSYESDLNALEQDIDQFFHLYPFGAVETVISNNSKEQEVLFLNPQNNNADSLVVDANDILFPQFTYVDPYDTFRNISDGKKITNLEVAGNDGGKINTYRKDISARQVIAAEMVAAANRKFADNYDQYSGDKQEEGMLFIGLENLRPLQTVSLLFQFAEGSAEDEDNIPPNIHWSYLTNNRWRPLPGENIVSDSTFGFQTTGIIKFDVPADATTYNTVITPGLIWLCASVSEHAERIPQLVNIFAQAVQVQFSDNNNAVEHFDAALPAGSISKLDKVIAQVGKVQQPFASFDGKHKEAGKEFYMRISERLRHKGRAVTPWDYEHLVLDRFPHIYKVKCISHTDPECICRKKENVNANGATAETCCGPQVAPGHVLVVPISDLKNRNATNPLQPKTSKRTLLAIEDYLSKRTSPFVKVHAKNPKYEQVIVYFQVQFYRGVDKGYYLKKLNDDIVEFLTPWAFDELADVQFNQKIYASSIINFIEERPYVDFITDFKMAVCDDPCCDPSNIDRKKDAPPAEIFNTMDSCDEWEFFLERALSPSSGEIVATPSTPRSILVSAPKHIIVPYVAPAELSPCEKRKEVRPIIVNPDEKRNVDIRDPKKQFPVAAKETKVENKNVAVMKTSPGAAARVRNAKTTVKKATTPKKVPAKKSSDGNS